MDDFNHLLSPINLGFISVKNRIVMAPMNTGFAGPFGEVTQKMIDYYEKRARHGVGLIVVEATGVVSDVKNMACQPRLLDDAYTPGFATLVERIKAYGTKKRCCGCSAIVRNTLLITGDVSGLKKQRRKRDRSGSPCLFPRR